MSGQEEDTDKQHEPSQKKLDDARKRGEIPKSMDLVTAATYFGLLLLFFVPGASGVLNSATALSNFLDRSETISAEWFGGASAPLSAELIRASGFPLVAWFLFPAGCALVTVLGQRAFVVAPEKLQPKGNRISPLSNLKNKFGASGLFEFFKSFMKLVIYSCALGAFLYWNIEEIVSLVYLNETGVLNALVRLASQFLMIVLSVALTLGAIDLVFQHHNHLRKNRMSRKELTDEAKEAEGDPHVKQKRRQRAYDIATNRMMDDVPNADVVVVNPTHYAVALKWSRATGSAPECVAKGQDEVAARIREVAMEHGIPIHSDPPTARALYATVQIGQQVQPDHYEAVAAAIRFADVMREKAKKKW